ncbi:MAG TPA: adenylate/guanylate cyclase domain-containing protein [Vicinamibacterales bacterium]|nr:adenylate/guanylate cyclase domain-containing protein [Vicinamibacterales bacterium]
MLRKVVAGVLLGLTAAAFVLGLGWAGLLGLPELKTYDWRVRRTADPAAVRQDIVLVEINDESIRAVAQVGGRWPWPRVVLADAIDFLKRGSPRAIAVDLHIAEPDLSEGVPYGGDARWTGAESDAALVESVRNTPRIIMLAGAVHLGVVGGSAERESAWTSPPYRLGPAIEERPQLVPPIPGLAQAAALGHNLLHPDRDGPARRMLPFIRIGGRYVPSLGVAAALTAEGIRPEEVTLDGRAIRVRDRLIPLVSERVPDWDDASRSHEQLTMLINYRAPAIVNGARPYTSYEIRDLLVSQEQLNAGQAPVLDPAVFKDKVVFIGLTASGLLDVFTTPFGEGVMPGIQLHASMADSILSNRFIRPAPETTRVLGTLAIAIVIGLMATMLSYWTAAAGAVLLTAGWLWLSLSLFRSGVWLNMSQPLMAGAVALFAGTAYQYFVEGAEKRAVKKLFGRYVSRDVYAQLIANPELAQLGGKRRDMSVLFSDIRGFTTVTEKGEPEALVAQLNEYFSRMVAIVFRRQGTVDKFVGDMVMALFGAPLDDPQHAEHAVEAAVEMVKELGELNRKWAAEGRTQLDIGIGVNSGPMIAGNIGSSDIMSYTVIGDNVNLGARLESLNKDYRTRIIISDATRALLHGGVEIRPLGDVVVKGKTRAVAIFEVIVPSPLQAAHEEAQS